ncbi:MAG: thymidine phosphorylase, partial [Bacilli bacterium]|nr:thymidine phosphorylase [Bacilli bacterium]
RGIKVDKHSTGGVGDKTTLVLAPLVASCNVLVAKMSGRGLGHTGGTIDKLESIKNFNVNLTLEQFKKQIEEIGVSITSQTGNLVPADKKIYALRDVSGTVDSIPLIASSIMSKKLASGADKIVIDVKVGDGALVKNTTDATKLAKIMINIGKKYQKEVICVLTNMDEPLGYAIGNGLEVKESIECLKGKGPKDLEELVVTLAVQMVTLAKNIDEKEAKKMIINNLHSGKAFDKFRQLIIYQGGDIDNIMVAPKVFSIKAVISGYVREINALKLGNLAKMIGAGRVNKDDSINLGVGFILSKKVGDYVEKDEELVKVYLDDKDLKINDILSCFVINKEKEIIKPLIYEIIR